MSDTPLAKGYEATEWAKRKAEFISEPALQDPATGRTIMNRDRRKIVDVIAWYYNRGNISPRMREAGETMQELFYYAGKVPVQVMQYRERVQGLSGDAGERVTASERLDNALDILERGEADAVWAACCYDHLVGRDGLTNLRHGLRALYEHFYNGRGR